MSKGRTHRVLGITTALWLCASLSQAGEKPSIIPIVSGSEGNRIWMEVSHAGNRSKAVPHIEISKETIRRIATAGERGNRLLAPPAKGEGKAQEERTGTGDFLERHKSLVIREGPEGVSVGNAFDLVGDLREAVKGKRGNRKKLEAIIGTLKRASAEREPIAGTGEPRNRPVVNLAAESGTSTASRVRSRSETP